MKKILITLIFIYSSNLFSQEVDSSKTNTSITVGYQAGQVLQTHEFLMGENATGEPIDYFQSLRLEFNWHTSGMKIWHQVFNNPIYGIGFYGANFFDKEQIGTPSAIYGYFDWPFARYSRSNFSAVFAFGFAYDWQEFDLETNPYNLTIGASRSVYIDAGIKYTYEIAKRWDLSGSISFTHFSNGSTQQPNAGINLMAPRIDLTYHFQKERNKFIPREVPKFNPHYEFFISPTYGSKSEIFDIKNTTDTALGKTRESFPVVSVIAAVSKQISYKSKIGIGTDIAYDQSLNVSYEEIDGKVVKHDGSNSDRTRWGIYGFYELVISNLSGTVGLGYYLKGKSAGTMDKFYQRLGVKYHLWDNFFFGLNLRFFDFGKADHMEYHVGYRTKVKF